MNKLLLCSCVIWMFGCSTTGMVNPKLTLDSSTQLEITMSTPSNSATKIKKGKFVGVVQVQPAKMVSAVESGKIKTAGTGVIKISKGDRFFLVKNNEHDELYCGFKNLYKNSVGSISSQACLSDTDNNGAFDRAFARTGSINKNGPEFIYFDSEVSELKITDPGIQIAYSSIQADKKEVFDIAYKFRGIEKVKGQKKAVFDVLTKRSYDRNWKTFPVREVKSISLDENGNAELDLSIFAVKIENASRNSADITIVKTPEIAGSGFKVNSDLKGSYKPAYRISGY